MLQKSLPVGAGHSRRTDPTLCSLAAENQHLVRLAQNLFFGTILDVPFSHGRLVVHPAPRVVRRVKIGGENKPRHQADALNYALKKQWIEFFDHLKTFKDGLFRKIEIAHGLPLSFEFEELSTL